MQPELKGKTCLILGSSGFIGNKLKWFLGPKCGMYITCPAHDVVDLETETSFTFSTEREYDYIINCASYNGGISLNMKNPTDILTRNTRMALNFFDLCKEEQPKAKIINFVASCGYADTDDGICREKDFLDGIPHDSVMGHAYAKRNIQILTKLYAKQYGLNCVTLCPTTVYGPGDSFDTEKTKVVGSLIVKICDKYEQNNHIVKLFGTGKPMREFIYIHDLTQYIALAMVKYNDYTKPLNIGTGQEYSIKDLAEMIANVIGYQGDFEWSGQMDGQMRKRLDLSGLDAHDIHIQHKSLFNGLKETIKYYRDPWYKEEENLQNA